jgi:hypothetical protein
LFCCVWLISLGMMFSRFIHIVACIRIPFLLNGWIIFHCVYVHTCIHIYAKFCLSVGGHLGFFSFWVFFWWCFELRAFYLLIYAHSPLWFSNFLDRVLCFSWASLWQQSSYLFLGVARLIGLYYLCLADLLR